MVKPILYSYFRSSCSWRVRIALYWKGIDYDYKAVHLVKGEQRSQDYQELNPMAQVPSLVIGDRVLTQSMAILEYLEEAYPENPLLPEDLESRFKVREICEIIGSGIQPLQNLSVLQQFDEGKRSEWASKCIIKGFTALEKLMASSSGQYCVGDMVTFADCFLVPQIYNAKRFQVNMEPFPNIARVAASLDILEPFCKARADNQPDTPPELK